MSGKWKNMDNIITGIMEKQADCNVSTAVKVDVLLDLDVLLQLSSNLRESNEQCKDEDSGRWELAHIRTVAEVFIGRMPVTEEA
jgi:hypothetical protein